MRISIKGARKTFATIVGAAQSTVGVLAVIVAYILYIDFFGLRAWLKVTEEFLFLYVLVLIVFGFFSITSGLLLVTEREESP